LYANSPSWFVVTSRAMDKSARNIRQRRSQGVGEEMLCRRGPFPLQVSRQSQRGSADRSHEGLDEGATPGPYRAGDCPS
jgi:hypothetical protein